MIYSLPCQFGEVVHSWELVAARLRCRNSLQRTGRRPSGARLRNESFRRWQDPGGDTAPTTQSSSTTDEGKINHLNHLKLMGGCDGKFWTICYWRVKDSKELCLPAGGKSMREGRPMAGPERGPLCSRTRPPPASSSLQCHGRSLPGPSHSRTTTITLSPSPAQRQPRTVRGVKFIFQINFL